MTDGLDGPGDKQPTEKMKVHVDWTYKSFPRIRALLGLSPIRIIHMHQEYDE